MSDTTMTISMNLVAFDKMSRVIRESVKKSDEEFTKLQNKIKKVSENLEKVGKAATVTGGVLTAMSAANIKMAADFETGMASVSTLIDTNVESLSDMNKEVLNIAKRTPVALNDLTSALYDIRSAGIAAENQFTVLEKSAQLGVAGLGSTSEAVDLVTSSLNAFQLKGQDAERVYDTIFKTVKFGKTTISGIAQGFGAVAGTISAANIKLDDYMAAVAALTTTGQPAAQAHHQLKAAIAGMTRENEDAVAVFKKLGVHNFKELIQKSGSMVNAFKAVTDQVKGNDAAILKIFGSTEAFNSVLGLTTKQHQTYIDTLYSMRSAPSLVDEGYAKKLDTVNAQLQRFQNFAQKIGIDMGTALVPYLRRFLDLAEKVMNFFDKIPEGIRNKIAVGIAGIGLGLTGIGLGTLAVSQIVKGFGEFLNIARDVAPILSKIPAPAKIFQSLGLSSTAQNFSFGNIFADIKRIDGNLRTGIINGFNALPGNIAKSSNALKSWAITSIQAFPSIFTKSLVAFKNGFLGIPGMIKNAMLSFRAFSMTLLTSPLGWVALIVTGAAILIYKYWEPITAFFKGTWKGLKEGLQPLMPIFKRMAVALEPIIKPIRSIIDWFKKLIKPVEDTGGAAENMGLRFGKAISGIIVKFVELIAKAFECGAKITSMLAEGIMKGLAKVKDCIAKVSQVIRDYLPHSPAKTGPLKDLHKVKIVETIAQTIKPLPLKNAMNKSLSFFTSGANAVVRGVNSAMSAPITIHYSPTITCNGNTTKGEFKEMLNKHKDEILKIFRQEYERKLRVAY